MKTFTTIAAILFFAISCAKENTAKQINSQSDLSSIADIVNTPINDLGSGRFKGYVGGLYPGGLNVPSGTYAIDLLRTCRNITPLDTFGNPSSAETAKILFISLGWSTGAQNMRALEGKTTGNPLTNPKLLLLSYNKGAGRARLNNIMNPQDAYWNDVSQRIQETNTSFRQVQIIYLETEDSTDIRDFPNRPILVKRNLETCFRVFKEKFPNVKLVYLLARTQTFGNNDHFFNLEPCPYYLGWACKWAIEDQINGVAGTAYKGPDKVSPMITWGFYKWATARPRTTDNFSWTPDLTTSDGFHANDIGNDTLATRFQQFLLTDRYARTWYAAR